MAVDVEIGNVAVQAFTHKVCQPAHRQNIARPVERDAIVEIEALICQNLFRNRLQTGIVGLKAVTLRRKSTGAAHLSMILEGGSGFGVSSGYINTGVAKFLG